MSKSLTVVKALLFATLACAPAVSPAAVTDAAQDNDNKTAKQDIKDAGGSTKSAFKKVGGKVKKGTKKVVNKAAGKTAEGADKVEDKTKQ